MKDADYDCNITIIFLNRSHIFWDNIYHWIHTACSVVEYLTLGLLFNGFAQKYHAKHCYIIFSRPGVSPVILTCSKNLKILPLKFKTFTRLMERSNEKPDTIRFVDVGTHNISIKNVLRFVGKDVFRLANPAENLIWWFFSRWAIKTHTPFTCSVLCCFILRLCGIHIPNIVYPNHLLEELTNDANNYNCWSRKSWEDCLSKVSS